MREFRLRTSHYLCVFFEIEDGHESVVESLGTMCPEVADETNPAIMAIRLR